MKVVHKNSEPLELTMAAAKQLEEEDELQKAASIYNKLIARNAVNEEAYHRLMIIYRKLKDPKKELSAINAGIKAFEEYYSKHSPSHSNKKVISLSKSLLKLTGLLDAKGKEVYLKEPLGKWMKRKKLVQDKLRKKS